MTRLNQLFPAHLIEALGWTILHSLWQGAVLAILLTIVWIALRKNSSQVRYFVATTALFTLFLVSMITFLSLYWSFAPSAGLPPAPPAPPSPSQVEIMLLLPSSPPQTAELNENLGFLADFQQYFQRHLPLIVSVWFLGVVVLMLRFLGGVAYLQRLKHHQNRAVAAQWQGTLRYLSAQIGVKQKVQLLESALVKVPMVIGYLKPVILMPLGTLSGLPVAQIESILAHELAHIRRHDYLVNILQSLVDIVLFFNPFAWWISECVREERENCCDDIALQATGDVLTFAKTLANLEALRLDSPQLAASFMGNKGSLKQRIQRIIYGKSQRPTFSEGFFSALVLVICMAAISFQAKADFYNFKDSLVSKVNEFINEKLVSTEDTEQSKIQTMNQSDENEQLQTTALADTIRFGEDFMLITSPNGKDFQIFKAGKLLTEEEYAQFSNLFTVEDATIKISNEALGNKDLEIKVDDKPQRLEGLRFYAGSPWSPSKQFHLDSLISNFKGQNDENFSFGWTSDNMTAEEVREYAAKIRKEAEITRRNAEKLRKELETNRYKAEINRAKTLEKSLESLEHHIHALTLNELATSPITGLRGFASRQQNQSKELREQLVKDGYLNDTKESFKIKIKKEEVFINGKRVKEQEKYKALIQKSFTGISINDDNEITIEELSNTDKEYLLDVTVNGFRLMDNPFEDSVNINLNFDDDKEEDAKHKALKEVLIEDGLMKKTDKKINITVKGNNMSINGKTLDATTKAKYEELLKRLFQFRFKMDKDWNIQIIED